MIRVTVYSPSIHNCYYPRHELASVIILAQGGILKPDKMHKADSLTPVNRNAPNTHAA